MNPRTIVIIGASGNQGSAVTKAFLDLPEWRVRCVTRSKSSLKAKHLLQLGVEVVEANLSDEEALLSAFAGAYAIFLNTDFWASYHASLKNGKTSREASQEAFNIEVQWGQNAVRAASKIPTLNRFVYSALGSMESASGGKYSNGLHWEAKAAIVDYIKNSYEELYANSSLLYVGAYSSNAFFRPQLDPKVNQYVAVLPAPQSTKCPVIDTAGPSIGNFARALIEDEPPGTKLLAYDEILSFKDSFDVWSKVTGKEYKCIESTLEDIYAMSGIPLEVLEVPAFLAEYDFMAGIEGAIEPWQLRKRFESRSYEDYLRTLKMNDLLSLSEATLSERFT